MRTSVYRFMKKGAKELARKLMDAGFDGDQRNGTGHIKFIHPITKITISVPVNVKSWSRMYRSIDEAIKQSNEKLKEMEKNE